MKKWYEKYEAMQLSYEEQKVLYYLMHPSEYWSEDIRRKDIVTACRRDLESEKHKGNVNNKLAQMVLDASIYYGDYDNAVTIVSVLDRKLTVQEQGLLIFWCIARKRYQTAQDIARRLSENA